MAFRIPTKHVVVQDIVFAWTRKGELFVLSAEDRDLLDKSWLIGANGYPTTGKALGRRGNQTSVLLHKVIADRMRIKAPKVDHKNQCKVNNLRSNIRGATNALNVMNGPKRKHNRSGYKNIHRLKHAPGYVVSVQGRKKYLGPDKLVEALSLRDQWVKEAIEAELAKI